MDETTDDKPAEPLMEAHGVLQQAFEQASGIRRLLDNASVDTAFAVGEAVGLVAKAKALLGRDIDDVRRRVGQGRSPEGRPDMAALSPFGDIPPGDRPLRGRWPDVPYTCPTCHRTSHHPDDARHRYCTVCGFEDDRP